MMVIGGSMNTINRIGNFWSGLALAALGTDILTQAGGWTDMRGQRQSIGIKRVR
jgi:hypothetical protein